MNANVQNAPDDRFEKIDRSAYVPHFYARAAVLEDDVPLG